MSEQLIEMCRFYSTTGYPSFRSVCKVIHGQLYDDCKHPGLKCHSKNKCLFYAPSYVPEKTE